MQPLVSLITPCYNGEKYLEEYLCSVSNQTYSNIEILFVDDGSTDNTKKIAKQFDINYFYIEHKGQAAAFNKALPNVHGQYITWADADDVLLKDAIKLKVEFLENNLDYGMVRNDAMIKGHRIIKDKNNENLTKQLILGTTSCLAGTYMIRTSLLDKIYPNRTIPFSPEGQNLQLLLPPSSFTKCGYINKPLLTYRQHQNSHSNKLRSFTEQLNRINNFYSLLLELKPYCNTNIKNFDKLANKYKSIETNKLIKTTSKRARK